MSLQRALMLLDSQNEKTRQKAGLSVIPEILKTFSATLSGSTTWTRTRDPVINSHLLYQLSYRGMPCMLLIQKEKSSICWRWDGFDETDGGLSIIDGYQKGLRGLP